MNREELIKEAYMAMEKAYSPYSGFKVGAAILTGDGNVYTGCNVENASYGATICAERCAALKAVSDGQVVFKQIAIVSSSREFTYPCGICRQFLAEFFTDDGIIILHDDMKGIQELLFFDEIPHTFNKNSIK